jgi:hypothetical protein
MFSQSKSNPSSSVAKTLRCSSNYSLGQQQTSGWGSYSTSSSTMTENDLLKFEDINMDLKELNALFNSLTKNKTKKNSNLSKLSKKKNSSQSNRNSIERRYKEEETKFTRQIKKILSEKIREKALQRLERLISHPKEERLNKVACAIAALIAVLKSCNVSTSYDEIIKSYKEQISKEYPSGLDGAEEFLRDILENKETSFKDFISKQSIHKKKLGEVLKTTIKKLTTCSA